MNNWLASNTNWWGESISDTEHLPFFYVIARSGVLLERGDGEIRRFQRRETAERAAEKLNRADHLGAATPE